VTGIGFNVYQPENGFPEEIAEIAGAITECRQKNLRARLAAAFIDNFYDICSSLPVEDLYKEYRRRCFIIGKAIYVLRGTERIPAMALDIDRDFGLKVRCEDGKMEVLSAGEVSIRQ
ncbi:MAG: biotin--[acetyl-CoA-carboxylase] ligase, partial [Lachnospiraceae bacterium]|nr:biotin--[acetyl-CoA-carboxylase] ligase [Lachnospiraceae bacterium]